MHRIRANHCRPVLGDRLPSRSRSSTASQRLSFDTSQVFLPVIGSFRACASRFTIAEDTESDSGTFPSGAPSAPAPKSSSAFLVLRAATGEAPSSRLRRRVPTLRGAAAFPAARSRAERHSPRRSIASRIGPRRFTGPGSPEPKDLLVEKRPQPTRPRSSESERRRAKPLCGREFPGRDGYLPPPRSRPRPVPRARVRLAADDLAADGRASSGTPRPAAPPPPTRLREIGGAQRGGRGVSGKGYVSVGEGASPEEKIAYLLNRERWAQERISNLETRLADVESKRLDELRAEVERHVSEAIAEAEGRYRPLRIGGGVALIAGLVCLSLAAFV
jgi:hypothetical protein